MQKRFILILALIVMASAGLAPVEASDSGVPTAAELISGRPHVLPIPGKVTMVDIGAHSCVPCKMMAPIIKELSQEYDGKAVIAFIDVWEHKEEAAQYGIRAIPTQIFYDAYGVEKYRHTGYMSKGAIEAKLRELGVE